MHDIVKSQLLILKAYIYHILLEYSLQVKKKEKINDLK